MADPILYYKAIIYKDAVHRPLGTNERISADSVPISATVGNQVRQYADGLYVGSYYARNVYYVDDVAGNDVPTAGAKATPFKTLDYCFQRVFVETQGDAQASYTVALKAGGTFTYTTVFAVAGNVKIAFYGDPKYGDFDNPGTVGAMATYMPVDLHRPVINIGIDPTSGGDGIGCFVLYPPADGSRSRITFSGVRMNLPTGNYVSGQGAVVIANQKTDAFVILEGTVVNVNGDNSTYGFLSVLPSSSVFLYQFGSQFLVDGIAIGANPTPPPTPIQLQRRKWFIKMHPDFYPTEETGYDPQMLHATPGTGLLNLSWSDTFTATDGNGNTAQSTWPVLTNATFGFGNYENILQRDNQGRPLNVISGRLF